MKITLKTLALSIGCVVSSMTIQANTPVKPTFSNFSYVGNDDIYNKNPLEKGEFYSPILQGCYPDPSICRKGNDYYLVCSSFAINPGVPIFHSNDLVNWKQIGHVLERSSQLKVEDTGISAGVYAPVIRYNPHNDTFYMITTQFAGGFGNIIVKSQDPAKGWSDPIKLNFEGIDPSIFFDDNGKAYIVHNDAPEYAFYPGHRVIKVWEYDVEKDQVIPGTDKVLVSGGVDISKKPDWIEAPHLYKKDGSYYLMCAEGGTGGNHSEVIFKGDSPTGPFKPAPVNPILSQRHLSPNRPDKVDWAGHADLVKGPDGKYYGVFLAIRPNEKGRVLTGRETFILPVDWSNEFPVFIGGMEPLKAKLFVPEGTINQNGKNGFLPNGNFTYSESFRNTPIDMRWVGVRGAKEGFASIGKNGLEITPYNVNIKAASPTSTLFYRQQHLNFTATATMDYQPEKETDLAGIVCFQSEKFHYVMGITKKNDSAYIVLQRTENGKSEIIASAPVKTNRPIKLQVEARGDNFRFSYAVKGQKFQNLGGTLSGDILSTNVAGGFTGNMIGLYATSANDIKL